MEPCVVAFLAQAETAVLAGLRQVVNSTLTSLEAALVQLEAQGLDLGLDEALAATAINVATVAVDAATNVVGNLAVGTCAPLRSVQAILQETTDELADAEDDLIQVNIVKAEHADEVAKTQSQIDELRLFRDEIDRELTRRT